LVLLVLAKIEVVVVFPARLFLDFGVRLAQPVSYDLVIEL